MAAEESTVFVLTVDGRAFRFELVSKPGLGISPREWGVIRRIADVDGPPAFAKSLQAYSIPLIAALAVIALTRAGQPVDEDAMLDGKYDIALAAEE